MAKRDRYLGKWFVFMFNGALRRAEVIDIEFETGGKPLFLMQTAFGNRFWLSRDELKHHKLDTKG